MDLRERPGLFAWTGLVVASTGLLFTHLLSAFMFLVVVGPVVLWTVVRDRNWKALGWLGLAAVATAAFSAAYLLPLLVERGLTYTEYLTGAWWGDWRANFLFVDPASVGAQASPIRPLVEMSFWYGVVCRGVVRIIALRGRDDLARLLYGGQPDRDVPAAVHLSGRSGVWFQGWRFFSFPGGFRLFSCSSRVS